MKHISSKAAIVALLLIQFAITAVAHVTPTPEEQAIIDANTAPSTYFTPTGTCTEDSVSANLGDTYLVVIGAGETIASGDLRAQVMSNGGAQIDFRVRKEGTITNIGGSVTAHLLFHENLSISGLAEAFWAVIEYSPDSTGDKTSTVANGNANSRFLPPGDVDPTFYQLLTGNFTQSGVGCTVMNGRLFFNDTLPVPSEPRNLYARGNLTGVRLGWNPPLQTDGGLTGYKIHRGLTNVSLSLLATIGTNQTYLDATAETGTRYYYCVKAYNVGGDSNCSDVESARLNSGFFGDDGTLWGEDGVEGMAANFNTTPGGMKSFVALPFLVAFLVIAWGLAVLLPANIALGGCLMVGVLFAAAIGVYPWWGVVFVGAVVAAILTLKRPRAVTGGM